MCDNLLRTRERKAKISNGLHNPHERKHVGVDSVTIFSQRTSEVGNKHERKQVPERLQPILPECIFVE